MSVLIEVDETILPEIDTLAAAAKRSRSEVINEILRKGLRKESHAEKARRFAESYRLLPQTPEEVAEIRAWEEVQDWGDEW